ncbi:MAG: hypothetical protein LBF38_11210 [Deltaproteobacteria bacterium]|jgi:hypothetical protein|nr:hypothetical protein [Deltaproteobacteria bacterium]
MGNLLGILGIFFVGGKSPPRGEKNKKFDLTGLRLYGIYPNSAFSKAWPAWVNLSMGQTWGRRYQFSVAFAPGGRRTVKGL